MQPSSRCGPKQVAKWIGIKLTKESFEKALSKLVSVLGGIVSGSLSWVTFSAMANRRDMHLSALPPAGGGLDTSG